MAVALSGLTKNSAALYNIALKGNTLPDQEGNSPELRHCLAAALRVCREGGANSIRKEPSFSLAEGHLYSCSKGA